LQFIVLGAGLSGLSCGIGLLETGHNVTILEKENTVGGLCRSFRHNECTFDYGPHFLFGAEILALLHGGLAPSLHIPVIRRTGERIFIHDRLFRFPFEPRNILKNMERSQLLLAVFDLVLARGLTSSNGWSNLEEWIVNAVGKRIYDYIDLTGYVEKLYGLTPEMVSAEWGQQKLKFLSRWRASNLVALSLQALKEGNRLERKVVSYPPLGIDTIPKKLAERFIELGGQIKTSTPAAVVTEGPDNVRVISTNGEEFDCDFLLSSIPLPDLAGMLSEGLAEAIAPIVANLKQRQTVFIFLYFDTARVMNFQCLYFTQPALSFRRVTEFKQFSSLMAPPDKSSLCVEVTHDQHDRPEVSSEMVHAVLTQLETTGHFDLQGYTHHEALIAPNTYPVYGLGYSDSLEKVLEHLSCLKRIMSFGRQGLFFYNTMNNSIIDGYRLGRRFKDGHLFSSIMKEWYRKRTGLFPMAATNGKGSH
jgi:protoporphyrinogen oxidase